MSNKKCEVDWIRVPDPEEWKYKKCQQNASYKVKFEKRVSENSKTERTMFICARHMKVIEKDRSISVLDSEKLPVVSRKEIIRNWTLKQREKKMNAV